MPEHVDITDPNIHEPKGASTATANQLYHADGSGSGSWSKIGPSQLDTSLIFGTNKFVVSAELPDVSTADSIRIACPIACTLNRVTTVLGAAITSTDSIITVTNSTGPATVGTITISNSGSAEGDIDTLSPVSNNTFTAGTYAKLATDGGSTGTAKLDILLEFTRTA